MPLYTFYPCREDGTSATFETYELEDDFTASVQARKVAHDHASCLYVAIWCGSRRIMPHPADDGPARPAARPSQPSST